jgi:hypothetical protein
VKSYSGLCCEILDEINMQSVIHVLIYGIEQYVQVYMFFIWRYS